MVYRVAFLVAPQLSPLIILFYKLNGICFLFPFRSFTPLLLKVWSSDEQPQGSPGSWLKIQHLGPHPKPR